MRVNALALSDWPVSDPPSEMHLRFCSGQKDSAVCCTPPPPSPRLGLNHGSSGGVGAAHVFTTCLILSQSQTRRLRRAAPMGPQERDRGLQKRNRK